MARDPVAPPADAKVGRKIDYLASRWIAPACKALGFERKGRAWSRRRSEGGVECIALLNLQSGKWNTGSEGSFFVNVGVQFPAVVRLVAQMPSRAWYAAHAEATDEGSAVIRGRIRDLLPAESAPWWPARMAATLDDEIKLSPATDLDALGETIARVLQAYFPEWLSRNESLDGVFAARGLTALGAGLPGQLAAGILLGRHAEAASLFREQARSYGRNEQDFRELRDWAVAQGLPVGDAGYVPRETPRPVASRRERWTQEVARETAEVAAFLADARPIAERVDAFLDACFHAIRQVSEAAFSSAQRTDVAGDPLLRRLLAEPDATQREVVVRALQRLRTQAGRVELRVDQVYSSDERAWDSHWGALIEVLLARPLPATEAFALDLLQAMAALVDRFSQAGTLRQGYRYPFAAIVRYLDAHARHWRQELKPAVRALLDAIVARLVAFGDAHDADVAARAAEPGADAVWIAAAQATQGKRISSLYARFPEAFFDGADADAVVTLQRWLRRDTDDALPFAVEDDDWSRQLAAAVSAWPAESRPKLERLLMRFALEGVASKPGARWHTALRRELEAFDATALERWLGPLLASFADAPLEAEWHQPGLGCYPGRDGGAMLLGLIQVAGCLHAAALAAPLARVAESAFAVTPQGYVRAQKAGNAAVHTLVTLPGGREALAALRAGSARPMLVKAVDAALASAPGPAPGAGGP